MNYIPDIENASENMTVLQNEVAFGYVERGSVYIYLVLSFVFVSHDKTFVKNVADLQFHISEKILRQV
ncbi:MAG TPA: hypothetical protein GX497_10500 [Bacillus bacterium]|nr:hypothetical protein [Bacillus sp. (in: firmicutes)]